MTGLKIVGILVVGLATSAFAEKLVKTGDTVAMMGDSITQYGTADSAGYVQLFLRAIRTSGAKVNFVGAGVAGNTSNQMRERFIRDVVEKKPTVVTINSGVNDAAFYSFPAQFDVYRDNIDFMVKAAQGAGAKVVLMTPTGTGGEKPNAIVAKLAEIMREYAASHEGVVLADSFKTVTLVEKFHNSFFCLLSELAGYHRAVCKITQLIETFLNITDIVTCIAFLSVVAFLSL